MGLHPLAGQPAPEAILIDVDRLIGAYYEVRPDLADPEQLVSFGTSGHRGLARERHVHRGAHPGHHPGDLRLPRSAGHHRPALSGQGHPRAFGPRRADRPGSAGGQRRRDRHPGKATASRRRRSSRTPSWPTTGAGQRGWPTASSSRRRTIRREDGGFKYNPPNGGPADTDVTRWIQDRANDLLRGGNRDVRRLPYEPGDEGHRRTAATISSCPTSKDLADVIDMDAIRAAGLADRRRSAGRRLRGLLGADRRDLRPGHHRGQPGRRSDVPLHDRRSRRQDPHGLLQPVRDGRPRRPQGPLRHRLRQRSRRRPARHRHRRRPA